MQDFQQEESPEFYRQRYETLKAKAATSNAGRAAPSSRPATPETPADDLVISRESVPGGWYWTGKLARGHSLRIANDEATPGVSVTFWNADDPSERFNHGDTVKLQWTVRLSEGKLLMSDMGRVLASITADTGGMHDPLLGGSTPAGNLRKYGRPGLRNAQENFVLAAGKHGLGPRDIGSVMNFFAPVITDDAGRFAWQPDSLRPGALVDLRAEMNLIVAISNTPHPMSPGAVYDARPIQLLRWRTGPVPADDICRGATEEAARAFDNTDSYFSQ